MKAHNLRRQLTLPDEIRERVADRPAAGQLSVTMANKLADMHTIAPELTAAVAQRITTSDLHDSALRDLGAFVHRTVVEDEHAYAVRIDDGALLDAAEHTDHARAHLTSAGREQAARLLGCEPDQLDTEFDTLANRARRAAHKLRISGELRDRARTGRYAYVHDRGQDFAAGIWVVDPVFMLDLIHEQLDQDDGAPAREDAYFAGARIEDTDLREAAADDRERRQAARARHTDATRTNLGLGHDIRAGLTDPTDQQLHALKALICHLLATHHRDVIAYGAGWTDQDRQQPVGDTTRHEPRHVDAILDAELERAIDDPNPLRGIAQLAARLGAAYTLDPDGVTRTKTLGNDRIARRLRDALREPIHRPTRHRAATTWDGWTRARRRPRTKFDRRRKVCFSTEAHRSTVVERHAYEHSAGELDPLGGDPASVPVPGRRPGSASVGTTRFSPGGTGRQRGERGRRAIRPLKNLR